MNNREDYLEPFGAHQRLITSNATSKGEIAWMTSRGMDASLEKITVLRAQAREAGAFEELVVRYERRLLYYIHRVLGSESDRSDVLQEIWLRVFLKITTLRAPEAFRVWIYKIAHDVAVSHLRKNQRHATADLTEGLLDEKAVSEPESDLGLLEDAAAVHAALEKLSLPHREVLTLRFLEELDLAEIAEITGCGVGTVKSRLHYARLEIRRLLETIRRE